jgi:predicted anti-sigma-YlaC factor YlaD
LISELGLELKSQQQTIYSDDDLLGSFDHSLLQHSATVSRTRGSERHLAEQAEKRRQRLKLAWKRFIFAIVGGIAIVVPVLIIVAGTASVKTLVVVSVSIFLFALGVALFSSAVPESLLAATAAYAAVLIVFVTSSSSTGGKG